MNLCLDLGPILKTPCCLYVNISKSKSNPKPETLLVESISEKGYLHLRFESSYIRVEPTFIF